jgi:hypothetical protein
MQWSFVSARDFLVSDDKSPTCFAVLLRVVHLFDLIFYLLQSLKKVLLENLK